MSDLGNRALWSMAREVPAWDVVTTAGAAVGTHERLVQLCAVVDEAIHTTTHAARPFFGLQWNRLKVGVFWQVCL